MNSTLSRRIAKLEQATPPDGFDCSQFENSYLRELCEDMQRNPQDYRRTGSQENERLAHYLDGLSRTLED